jgi:hypothetical protein
MLTIPAQTIGPVRNYKIHFDRGQIVSVELNLYRKMLNCYTSELWWWDVKKNKNR